jgi:hypothetical protein
VAHNDQSHENLPGDSNYVQMKGSERHPSTKARLLGPTDPDERFTVTIILRRRPDGEPMPGPDYYLKTPLRDRQRLPEDVFAAKYGASPADLKAVTDFARENGLAVEEARPVSRSVKVSGTVQQMSKAFGVALNRYEHEVTRRAGDKPFTETYRGRDGFIYIPKELAEIVVGVFGLDNRRITKCGSPCITGDPPNTKNITVPTVAGLYQFPPNSAAGQTIAIFSEAGYQQSDLTNYFNLLPGFTAPHVTPIPVDASNNGSEDLETTQDICIAASAAPGADIAVYFTTFDQPGWVDLIGRVVHPLAGDSTCSVLSSSFYVSADDTTGNPATSAWISAVNMALQDAARQSVTFCTASGDQGVQCQVPDGQAHTIYPATDPYALACGGTTIGNVTGESFTEYVWNDTFNVPGFYPSGCTGGGVSAFFTSTSPYSSQYSYQSGASVPASINDGHLGRGVPDVAANSSPNSGYPLNLLDPGAQGLVNPVPMSGTSAAAPLWAGLIAIINSALGLNVGFVNPAIYAIGSAGFNTITGAPGPISNCYAGHDGYPFGPGWNACTGWGSPDGISLLNGLAQNLLTQDMQFWVEDSTFGAGQVQDSPSYGNAFWLVLDGFTPDVLGISGTNPSGTVSPIPSGAFMTLLGATNINQAGIPVLELPGGYYNVQRIRYPFNINFPSGVPFPSMGNPPAFYELDASITVPGNSTPFTAKTVFELVAGANPYFANIDPNQNNVFWLSQDMRLFTITPTANNQMPVGNVPFTFTTGSPTQLDTAAAYNYVQSLVGYFNNTYSDGSTDPFASTSTVLPNESGVYTGDSTVTPATPNPGHPTEPYMNYNFALARVRLRGPSGSSNEADNVKVFFRIFGTQTNDTDYINTNSAVSLIDPFITYPSTPAADPDDPSAPLPGTDSSGNINGCTLPFFADPNELDLQPATMANPNPPYGVNNRNIIIPMGDDTIWTYFGCFLNVYDDTVTYGGQTAQQWLAGGTHHCIVAQIAYEGAPIENEDSVIESPENSDKLAQRNLQVTPSSNPGFPLAHRIPQTFDLRPSPNVTSMFDGYLTNVPDELMIDWRNTPVGSTASIYWPQLNADQVIALATKYHSAETFTKADNRTIQFKVLGGVTYLPIPTGSGENFAGLFTLDLPSGIRVGEEFQVVVRRITSRQLVDQQPVINATGKAVTERLFSWRYVVGSFQITVPVEEDNEILPQDENLLAILKWRQTIISKTSRWYPILQRYIAYIEGRIIGMGGNPSQVQPSQLGTANQQIGQQGLPIVHPVYPHEKEHRFVGKVENITYDRFGDFEGFRLRTEHGEEEFFHGRESHVEDLVLNAWNQRMLIAVTVDDHGDWPAKIVLLKP